MECFNLTVIEVEQGITSTVLINGRCGGKYVGQEMITDEMMKHYFPYQRLTMILFNKQMG